MARREAGQPERARDVGPAVLDGLADAIVATFARPRDGPMA
jgi:hypothetical protein